MFLTNHIADRRARVLERHQGDVNSADMMDVRFFKMLKNILIFSMIIHFYTLQHFESLMEPIHEDEPNTITVNVTKSMTREDVFEHVRKCI